MHFKIIIFVSSLLLHSIIQPMWLLDYFKNNDAKIEHLHNDVLKEILKECVIPKSRQARHIRAAAKNFRNLSLTCKYLRNMINAIEVEKINIDQINDKSSKEEVVKIRLSEFLSELMACVKSVNMPVALIDPDEKSFVRNYTELTYKLSSFLIMEKKLSQIEFDNETIIREMLNDCHDVNARNLNGKTPLYYAIADNSANVVRLLLNYGADVYNLNNNPVDFNLTQGLNALELAEYLACHDKLFKIALIKEKHPELLRKKEFWCTIL